MTIRVVNEEPRGAEVTEDVLREALRGELSALGSSHRRTLLDRVIARVAPTVFETSALRARCATLLDSLAWTGDAFSGAGGIVGAAPLRAVRVSDSLSLLVGATPTARLRRRLSGVLIEDGALRRATIGEGEGAAFERALLASGGAFSTVVRWSGLDRVPTEIQGFWQSFSARMLEDTASPTDFEPGEEVKVCAPTPQGYRWRSPAALSQVPMPRLERHQRLGGWFAYAWVDGQRHIALSADEGVRMTFLLDAQAHTERVLHGTRYVMAVEIDVDLRLPTPEYRLLLGVATELIVPEQARWVRRWRVPHGAWAEVERALTRGLGVKIDLDTPISTVF